MRPERQRLSSQSLSLIGIPKKFHESTIEDFNTYDNKDLEEVQDCIARYVSDIRFYPLDQLGGLCLFGSNGVGKTLLACIIAKEAYKYRYSTRRVTFVEYMTKYTASWNARSVDEKEQLESELYDGYKAVEFLVLEEVGKEVDSKASAPILEDLLRYREDKGLVTIICTNLSPKDIESRYGVSVSSLLKGNMTPIKIEGIDKRKDFFKKKVSKNVAR